MTSTKRAGVYVRVSTPGQEERGASLETQEQECRAYAERRGYEVVRLFREVQTGYEFWERPQLAAARDAIRQQALDVLIVHDIDRLSRRAVHVGIVLSEAERDGAAIEFVLTPLDASPEGQLILSVKGYAAEIEREKIRERHMRGKRARVAAGKVPNFGPELFGYRRDKAAGVRLVYEPEAATVRQVFQWAAEGLPVRTIARRLEEQGTPAPTASKAISGRNGQPPHWGKTTVHRILHESAYTGESFAWRRKRESKSRIQWRDRSEWLPLAEGSTPALVSSELWQAVQERLGANHGAETRNVTRQYLLRGRLRCAVCGRALYSSPERGGRRVYRCSSRETPAGPCGGARVPAEAVEAWAWAKLRGALLDPSIFAAQMERMRADGADQPLAADREAAARQLAKLERQQERLIARYRQADDDSFPWELVEREIARAEQEKRQLQALIIDVDQRIAESAAALERFDALRLYCERWAPNVDALDFDGRRDALAAFGVEVVANGRAWDISGGAPLGDDVGELSRTYSDMGHGARFRFRFSTAAEAGAAGLAAAD